LRIPPGSAYPGVRTRVGLRVQQPNNLNNLTQVNNLTNNQQQPHPGLMDPHKVIR